jgi:hypothetical protein
MRMMGSWRGSLALIPEPIMPNTNDAQAAFRTRS